ncbi:MAG: hypothetical protein V3R16_09665 [Nitrospirales bacterium]
MIRVEITEWQLGPSESHDTYAVGGAMKPNNPEAPPAEPHWQRHRTLLLQDFDGLNVERVIALVNGLRVWEPCTACGHAYHVGNCTAGSGYNECRCHSYETATQKELAEERDKLQHAAKEYGKLEARVQVQTRDAEKQDRQIATLTRSRDRLLSQKGKRR